MLSSQRLPARLHLSDGLNPDGTGFPTKQRACFINFKRERAIHPAYQLNDLNKVLLLLDAIYKNGDFFVVKAKPALDLDRLCSRVDVVPDRILDLTITDFKMIIVRLSLVRTKCFGIAGLQKAPVSH